MCACVYAMCWMRFWRFVKSSKAPQEECKGTFPIYTAIAAFLRVIKSLGSGSLIRGFSRMQVLVAKPFTAGSCS